MGKTFRFLNSLYRFEVVLFREGWFELPFFGICADMDSGQGADKGVASRHLGEQLQEIQKVA
jgi:hypothetical protein